MRKIILLILSLALGVCGCVKKSEYEALKQQYDDTFTELGTTSEKAASLEEALAAEEARLKELQAELDETSERLAAVEAALAKENEETDKLKNELNEVINDRARLKSSAAELKRALAELNERKREAEKRVAEFRKLLKRFQSLIDAGKLKVRIIDGRMVLVLPTDILFDSGSAKLSEEGEAAIKEVADILATMKKKRFQVGGHTDNVPISTSKYKNNWELAADRALGVVKAMIDAGVSGKSLSAASYGKFQPVASNKTPAGKAANRRIDIVIVPDLSKLPGFKELQKIVESK